MNRFSDQELATRMLEYRSTGYTYRSHFRRTWLRYLAVLAFVIIWSLFSFEIYELRLMPNLIFVWISGFSIGHGVAIIIRDYQWVESLRRQCPFLEKTTDWDTVQKLADGQAV